MNDNDERDHEMEERREKAHALMEEALILLDQTDDHFVGAHLDFAIALMGLPRKYDC